MSCVQELGRESSMWCVLHCEGTGIISHGQMGHLVQIKVHLFCTDGHVCCSIVCIVCRLLADLCCQGHSFISGVHMLNSFAS